MISIFTTRLLFVFTTTDAFFNLGCFFDILPYQPILTRLVNQFFQGTQ